MKILKRSWEILWRYRALWLFGVLLALTTSRGNPGSNFNYSFDSDSPMFQHPGPNGPFGFGQNWDWPQNFGNSMIGIAIALGCVVLLLTVVFVILRYISTTALIRMVNDYEETGEKHRAGHGFRLGWSRASWRIFLIDLVIGIPFAILILFLLALAASPLLLWTTENQVLGILGTIAAVGLFFLFILFLVIFSAAIRVFVQFIYRAAALQNLGVFDSIRAGIRLVRSNLKDAFLMWLILLGIQIVYGIAMLVAGILLLFIALLVAGVPGLIGAGFGSLFDNDVLPFALGLGIALPILLVILIIPSLFLGGLKEVYLSTSWTLTFREMMGLKGVSSKPEPLYDNDGIEDEPARGDDEPDPEDIPSI